MARIKILLLFIISLMIFTMPVYAEGTVIGQAASGEKGLSGNAAGDQTGNEVSTCNYYGGWKYVFRVKDPETAKKLAENMKAACANSHIGYDMKDRMTLYQVAEANDWDIASISTDCETTCVDLVSVCLNAAGIDAPKGWASVSVYNDLMPTGLFECIPGSEYNAAMALPGDILCAPDMPHSAMIVESPNKFTFKVKYHNKKGKTKTVKVQEGDVIIINPNNGNNTKAIKVESNVNLKKYEPKRNGAEFQGWTKEDGQFSANFDSQLVPIYVKNERKKVGQN